MHLFRPFCKIMDSSNYIMHANDLTADWRLFCKNQNRHNEKSEPITVIHQVIWAVELQIDSEEEADVNEEPT